MSDWHAWVIGAGIGITMVYVLDLLGAIHTIVKSKAAILELEAKERKAEAMRSKLEQRR